MNKNDDAPFAYAGLERIFHERGRLAVCTCLIANADGMRFTDLQDACALTDGNLNRHLHALAEVGIVTLERLRGKHAVAVVERFRVGDKTLRFLESFEHYLAPSYFEYNSASSNTTRLF